jgi:hypothetical protein
MVVILLWLGWGGCVKGGAGDGGWGMGEGVWDVEMARLEERAGGANVLGMLVMGTCG